MQDLFVIISLDFKKNGFFVEFGATDGEDMSNTYLLEKTFAWNGILVEPSKHYHKGLYEKRNCTIDQRCVYSSTGEEVEFNDLSGTLSTINAYSDKDFHKDNRRGGTIHKIETVRVII